MTLNDLMEIRNPKLTVDKIFNALSRDEREELRKKVISDSYPRYNMRELWSILTINEKKSLIEVIALWVIRNIIIDETTE